MANTEATIKVIVVEPNKKAAVKEIDQSLENLQEIVDGYIECVYPFEDNVCLICNEEGKLGGYNPNRALKDEYGNIYDIVFGTFIIAGLGEEDFASLTEEQVETYMEMYGKPKQFVSIGGSIVEVDL